MEDLFTDSSESLEIASLCLICCSGFSKNFSNINTNPSILTANIDFDANRVTKAIEKIFEYLLIPLEHLVKVKKKKSLLSFCSNCDVIVKELIALQKKAEILELQIRWKVETLGRIAIDTPTFGRINGSDQKEVAEVWNTFKAQVTRNFLQGLLPNPSVRLEKTVNVETKAFIQLGKVNNGIPSCIQKSKTVNSTSNFNPIEIKIEDEASLTSNGSSECIILEENITPETDENMDKVVTEKFTLPKLEKENYDSNEDLIEIPSIHITNEVTADINNQVTLTMFENAETTCTQEEIDDSDTAISNTHPILSINDTSIITKNNNNNCNISENKKRKLNNNISQALNAARNSISSDTSYKTVENKIFVGESDTDEDQEMNLQITDSRERIKTKDKNYEINPGGQIGSEPGNKDASKTKAIRLDTSYKVRNVRRKTPRTECINSMSEDASSSKKRNRFYYEYSDNEISRPYSDFSNRSNQPKRRKFEVISNRSTILSTQYPYRRRFFTDNKSYIRDLVEPKRNVQKSVKRGNDSKYKKKELYGLIQGKDYYKCTKCDYTAKKTPTNKNSPSTLRLRVADHYSRLHNPVSEKLTEEDTTISGKHFYKCTLCTFSILSKSNAPSALRKCYQKLSLHYMEVHDKIESESESNNEDPEGQDDLKCTKCNYDAEKTFESGGGRKRQISPRNKLADHYIDSHIPTRDIKIGRSKTYDGQSKSCYWCSKCSFLVACLSETYFGFLNARRKVSFHYMTVHDIFERQQQFNPDLTSLTEGKDYFACLSENCNYIAFTQKEKNPKQQVQHARLNLIEHYRISRLHFDHRKNIIPDITIILSSKYKTVKKSYYKCTKCDFKSVVRFLIATESGAQKVLIDHFLHKHIFPMERFESNTIDLDQEFQILRTDSDFQSSPKRLGQSTEPEAGQSDPSLLPNTYIYTDRSLYSNDFGGDIKTEADDNVDMEKTIENSVGFQQLNVDVDENVCQTVDLPEDEDETRSEEVIIKNEIWIESSDNEGETNGTFSDSEDSIIFLTEKKKSKVKAPRKYFSNKLLANSARYRSKRRKQMWKRLTISKNSIKRTISPVWSPADFEELKKELEGLIEGRDYLKCTECDYYATNTPNNEYTPFELRNRVAEHFALCHKSLFKQTKTSKKINGKLCYRCNKCRFSVVFERDIPSSRHKSRLKLSLHYMEFHDKTNSNPELTSLTEGVDYFACHFENCNFVSPIKREDSPKQQLENAVKARLQLIKHYRTSLAHVKEIHKINWFEINITALPFRPEGVNYYKCTKCDFKSFVDKSFCGNSRVDASKGVKAHFWHEHVFPWEKFPGLYKYGCYEEKCEDVLKLKCFYTDCDFCVEIQCDVEGKIPAEFHLAAYKTFFENHGLNHNFNLIGLENDNFLSAESADNL